MNALHTGMQEYYSKFKHWNFRKTLEINQSNPFHGTFYSMMKYFWVAFVWNGCYHYFVFFLDLVHGYSKSKLLVKKQVPWNSKIRFGYVFCNFCYCNFLLWSIFSPLVDWDLRVEHILVWYFLELTDGKIRENDVN